MTDENMDSGLNGMPLLVYVAREKRPSHPHHFKGGALNVLLRVSAVISNAPYFLVLDCDMYCYDPSSTALYVMRMWMMKSGSCYFYGVLNAVVDRFGLHKADFTLTNKVVDSEQAKRLEQGIYDFQASPPLLVPLCVLLKLRLRRRIPTFREVGLKHSHFSNFVLTHSALLAMNVVRCMWCVRTQQE